MKPRLYIIIPALLILAVVAWFVIFKKRSNKNDAPVPVAIAVNSSAFNTSLKTSVDAYTAMNEAFVNWDSAGVNANAARLLASLDSLKTEELKNDTAVYETVVSTINIVKTETNGILSENNWKEKRGSLNVLSQNFYDLLRTVQYDVDRIYYQECPMAFGEDTYGYWVSTQKAIRNPYLGTSDPEWGRKMLACGSTRDSLKFYDKKANP